MLSGSAVEEKKNNKAPKAFLSGSSGVQNEAPVCDSQLGSSTYSESYHLVEVLHDELFASEDISWNSYEILLFSNLNKPSKRRTNEDIKSMPIMDNSKMEAVPVIETPNIIVEPFIDIPVANATKPKCCTIF